MELSSEVVERGRRGRQEAGKDREMLWWIGRFRFVTSLERDPERLGDSRVLTERESRQAERAGGRRWSVDVIASGKRQRRWPDLVLDFGGRRRAIELELAVKHTRRLEQIVEAYQRDRTFDEVLWLVEVPTLLVRLETMIERNRSGPPALRHLLQPVPMRVVGHVPRA